MIIRSSGSNMFGKNEEETSGIEFEIRLRYSAIRSGLPNDMPITVLHIGEQKTAIATGTGAEPGRVMLLAIGSQKTSFEFFKHNPPTAGELENAIMAVEDEVTRARTMITHGSPLFTSDPLILEIAINSGVSEKSKFLLSRDEMARTFDRFAQVTLGSSAAHQGIPTGTAFAATLLILREFMHHLLFTSITVKA